MSCNQPFNIVIPDADHDPEPDAPPVPVVPAAGSGPVPAPAGTGSGPVPGSGSGPVPAGSEPGTDVLPVIDVPDARTTTAEHLLALARRWARDSAINQRKHRRFSHRVWDEFWNGHPESLGQHRAYIKSHQWLNDTEKWLDGWIRWIVKWENIAFAVTIGRFMKVTGNNWSRIGERQLRFWLVILTLGIVYIVLKVTGH